MQALLRLLILGLLSALAWSQPAPELRLAMSGGFQPFSSTDSLGRLVGFDADIARLVARRMGRTPVLIQVDWNGIQAGLQSGKYDLICGSLAITPERSQRMAFSLPYYVSGAQVFARDSLKEVRGVRLGVTEASTYARYLEDHSEQFPQVRLLKFGSEAEIVEGVRADKVDAFISDRIVGGFYLQKSSLPEMKERGPLLYQEACGIAGRLQDRDLIRKLNLALLDILQDGSYAQVYRRWVGVDPDISLLFQSWSQRTELLDTKVPPESAAPVCFVNGMQDTLALLLQGAWLTLQLTVATAVLSFFTGALVAATLVVGPRASRCLAQAYVLIIRGTPLLVQLFVSYFGVATLVHRMLGYDLLGAWGAALLALWVNTTAYNAETLRGGIGAVEAGQWDAAACLGMTRGQALRRIVFPQALRNSLASLGNNLVVLIKDTSLVGAITLVELTYTARNIVFQTGQAFFPFFAAGALYLLMITGASWVMRGVERGWSHE